VTAPHVSTRFGAVEGLARAGHQAYLGLPFASPPVGSRRFRRPEPPAVWSGTLSAQRFRPAAMQGAGFAPGTRVEGAESEDCLYLNVFTPAADGRKRPVMFWVHGGAFTVGTAGTPLYDGGALATLGDVVVVTTNYRVGALGFLALGDDGARWGAEANLGLWDQLAALRWVHEHIENCGGDPEQVTLFGESAGATSVSLLMVNPRARGLFRRAIAQSSTGPLTLPPVQRAAPTADALLGALGLTRAQSERLQQVPAAELLHAQEKVEANLATWPHFYPVHDGALISESPAQRLASGACHDIAFLAGSNRDEWNLFAAADVKAWQEPLTPAAAVEALFPQLPRRVRGETQQLFDTYTSSRKARGLPHDPRAIVRAILGDARFVVPGQRFMEAHVEGGGRAFSYLFTYESPGLRGALGACHALELPFVFGTLSAPGQDRFAGAGAHLEALSRHMMQSWVAFARTGDPSHGPLDPWPPYEADSRATMQLDVTSTQVFDPFSEERAAWDGLI
jgi:para-nitrobenzyl esterase